MGAQEREVVQFRKLRVFPGRPSPDPFSVSLFSPFICVVYPFLGSIISSLMLSAFHFACLLFSCVPASFLISLAVGFGHFSYPFLVFLSCFRGKVAARPNPAPFTSPSRPASPSAMQLPSRPATQDIPRGAQPRLAPTRSPPLLGLGLTLGEVNFACNPFPVCASPQRRAAWSAPRGR